MTICKCRMDDGCRDTRRAWISFHTFSHVATEATTVRLAYVALSRKNPHRSANITTEKVLESLRHVFYFPSRSSPHLFFPFSDVPVKAISSCHAPTDERSPRDPPLTSHHTNLQLRGNRIEESLASQHGLEYFRQDLNGFINAVRVYLVGC